MISNALVKTLAKKLYLIAFVIFVLGALNKTALMYFAYSSDLYNFNPLVSNVLRYINSEMQGLLSNYTVSVVLVLAFICNPLLAKMVEDREAGLTE